MRVARLPVLALLSCLLWTGCARRSRDPVRIGFMNYPPLFVGSAGKEPQGFVADVFREAARREDVTIQWRHLPTGPRDALAAGQIDLWPMTSANWELPEGVSASRAWWRNEVGMLVRTETPVRSPADLRGRRVAIAPIPSAREVARKYLPGAIPVEHPGLGAAQEALCRGSVDAMVVGYVLLQDFLLTRPAACREVSVRTLILEGPGTEFSILAGKDAHDVGERLRDRIDEMAADGTLFRIAMRYPTVAPGMALYLTRMASTHYRGRLVWVGFLCTVAVLLVATVLIVRMRWIIRGRKRAERLLELRDQALQQAVDGVAVADAQGLLQYVNPALARMHGVPASSLTGKPITLLLDNKGDAGQYAEAIARRGSFEGQVLQARSDGTTFPTFTSVASLTDEDGNPTGLVAMVHDRSLEQGLEEQLRQAQKMEAVGQLAGGIAHDFNNLLTIILGGVHMALSSVPENSSVAKGLNEAAKACERGADLTRSLLSLSRRQVLKPRVLSLNAVVKDAEDLLRRAVGEDVRLVTRLDPKTGLVKADPGQLNQVLLNLAVNARDAMPQGGSLVLETRSVTILPETGPQSVPPGRYTVLEVRDTGQGMPPEVLARIFEPFYSTKEPGKGTGLGLSIVYGIVNQSGGRITVSSAVGRGTTFRIMLPRHADAEPAPAPAPQPAQAFIMVVDTDPQVRQLVADVLGASGREVLSAADPAGAARCCSDAGGSPSLVIAGVEATELERSDVLKWVRSLDPPAKLLLLTAATGWPPGFDRERVSAFLPKPFSPVLLIRAVNELLNADAAAN